MSIIAFKMVLQLNSVILIKELKRGVEPNSGKIYFLTTAVLCYYKKSYVSAIFKRGFVPTQNEKLSAKWLEKASG